MPEITKEHLNSFTWEKDPLYFIFHEWLPGKVKMHTKKMEWDDWIKIDDTYYDQMKLRRELLLSTKDTVFVSNTDDSTELAKWELFDLVVDYLPKRFPEKFELREGCIYNKVLKEEISLDRNDPMDPLIRAGELTQEDWVVLEYKESEDAYVVTAGIVSFPMRWSLQEKWNQPIAVIHGPVKGFMKHLVKKVSDLFRIMKPENPIQRANWAVFNDLKDPLDLYTPTGHDERNEVNTVTPYQGELTGRILTFRAEYQTLRKLPKSGAIIFSIRTYQRFLEEFKMFPVEDAKGLIYAIENLDEDFNDYKGADFWKDAAIKYLQKIVDDKQSLAAENLWSWSWVFPVTAVVGTALVAGLVLNRYQLLHS